MQRLRRRPAPQPGQVRDRGIVTATIPAKTAPGAQLPGAVSYTLVTVRTNNSSLSIKSKNSMLSVCSVNSMLSIGSVNSFMSIGSIGSAFSIGSIGSFASVACILSSFSALSAMSYRAWRKVSGWVEQPPTGDYETTLQYRRL